MGASAKRGHRRTDCYEQVTDWGVPYPGDPRPSLDGHPAVPPRPVRLDPGTRPPSLGTDLGRNSGSRRASKLFTPALARLPGGPSRRPVRRCAPAPTALQHLMRSSASAPDAPPPSRARCAAALPRPMRRRPPAPGAPLRFSTQRPMLRCAAALPRPVRSSASAPDALQHPARSSTTGGSAPIGGLESPRLG